MLRLMPSTGWQGFSQLGNTGRKRREEKEINAYIFFLFPAMTSN